MVLYYYYHQIKQIEVHRKQQHKRQKGKKILHLYGFCFYYDCFYSKKLIENPIELLVNNPDIDINFCLCWDNKIAKKRTEKVKIH